MRIVQCPICGNLLAKKENSLICRNHHTFDSSSKGYVHLLPVNRKNSKQPGDDKQMVISRNIFLNAGYFNDLSKAINSLAIEYFNEKTRKKRFQILDSGCGEGYYIDSLAKFCTEQRIQAEFYGIDISKDAVRIAASRNKSIFFAVASSFALPILSNSVDCLLQIFAPCSDDEFHRIMKEDGIIISVIPGKKHLLGLKEILYDKPYENDEKEYPLLSFKREKQVKVAYTITVTEQEHIRHLFRMTPYYWRTNPEKTAELNNIEFLETPCEFVVTVYSRK